MKTDPRVYNWLLTGELANIAGKQGLTPQDIIIQVCTHLKAKGDPGCSEEASEDFVELIDPEYVARWARTNIRYAAGCEPAVKRASYTHLRYHGKEITASKLSKLTGLQVNTIYIYWSKCNKDPTAFDLKIDKRIDKAKDLQPPMADYSDWEVNDDNV